MYQDIFAPSLPGKSGQTVDWHHLYGSARALAIANLAKKLSQPLIIITKDLRDANQLKDELDGYLVSTEMPVNIFPDWETLPYDLISPYQDIISDRLAILFESTTSKIGILIIAVTTAMHRMLPREYLHSRSLVLKLGQQLERESFRAQLLQCGYRLVNQVMHHGEISTRGSLIDVFPMGIDSPIRIDLLDDQIDSIRTFDIETQCSIDKLEALRVLPSHELALDDEGLACFKKKWGQYFGDRHTQTPIYQDVSKKIAFAGIEYYLPLFYEETNTIFDYLSERSIVIFDESLQQSATTFWQEIEERYEQRRYDIHRPVLKPELLFLKSDELKHAIKPFHKIQIVHSDKKIRALSCDFRSEKLPELTIKNTATDPLSQLRSFMKDFGGAVLIVARTLGRQEFIINLFRQYQYQPQVLSFPAFLAQKPRLAITVMPIEDGLILGAAKIAIFTEAMLFEQHFNQQEKIQQNDRADHDSVIYDLPELSPGTYVVHEEHGIGVYRGLITIETNGILQDFMDLEYADGDKLYVPINAMDQISRYTGGDIETITLHHLGHSRWKKQKQKVASRVHDISAELLAIHAQRMTETGYEMDIDQKSYQEFVKRFPFEETPDQQRAINAVIDDMRQTRKMDRVICGDAGFGKTEVAIRAAFIAVHNAKQVIILVPTTLLAEQHYQNFIERFIDWPVKTALLSRFCNKKEQQQTIKQMEEGKVDIIIGTHKLLQQDIKIKRLGLLIVDEEHRFGVRQKEKIKMLGSAADILTLTATPIPRTLNMALLGIRDLSIISTPPSRRLAVKTFLHQHHSAVLKEALLREIRRGGQVFYLHNDTNNIEQISKKINRLSNEIQACFAHGKMHEKQLDSIMRDFYHQRFNVLVCTTIVENGLDVTNANTIIIDRADKLGLATLYQLRGRVGRSHHRAYAYLLVPEIESLKPDARKRLESITSMEELGIGFTLATHDLEIRGAGELLGAQQSGHHIREIGFHLYMKLLQRTVKMLKQGEQPQLDHPLDHGTEIDLNVCARIPEDFIADVHTRLMIYKRLANIRTESERINLKTELIDRFGPLPEELEHLLLINILKEYGECLGISRIECNKGGGKLYFKDKPKINSHAIIKLIQQEPMRYKLDGQDKLKMNMALPNMQKRLAQLDFLFHQIASEQLPTHLHDAIEQWHTKTSSPVHIHVAKPTAGIFYNA